MDVIAVSHYGVINQVLWNFEFKHNSVNVLFYSLSLSISLTLCSFRLSEQFQLNPNQSELGIQDATYHATLRNSTGMEYVLMVKINMITVIIRREENLYFPSAFFFNLSIYFCLLFAYAFKIKNTECASITSLFSNGNNERNHQININ